MCLKFRLGNAQTYLSSQKNIDKISSVQRENVVNF